jgi:hypothetical protein
MKKQNKRRNKINKDANMKEKTIAGSHGGVNENGCLLGCSTAATTPGLSSP